jgi:hypothetical protein
LISFSNAARICPSMITAMPSKCSRNISLILSLERHKEYQHQLSYNRQEILDSHVDL